MAEAHASSELLRTYKAKPRGAIPKYNWDTIKPGVSLFFKCNEVKLVSLRSLAWKRGKVRGLKFVVLNSYNGYYEVGIAGVQCHKDQSEVCMWPTCTCIELSKVTGM